MFEQEALAAAAESIAAALRQDVAQTRAATAETTKNCGLRGRPQVNLFSAGAPLPQHASAPTGAVRTYGRRSFLGLSAAASAATILQASALAKPRPEFTFAVITDLHYRDQRCGAWFERVVQQLRSHQPALSFVVLAGDLADEGTAEQLGAVREIARTLPMPVHAIIGNHDCANDGSHAAYVDLYGRRLNYRFDLHGYHFLAFDTTQGRSVYRTRISTETLGWLDHQLRNAQRDQPVVALTHFPLGRNWLRPVNAYAALDRLQRFPLLASFSGHWHGLTRRDERGATLTTGRCCSWWRTNHDGSDLRGYMLCRAAEGRITSDFVAVSRSAFPA